MLKQEPPQAPPTEKLLAFARRMAESTGVPMPPKTETELGACRIFVLDAHFDTRSLESAQAGIEALLPVEGDAMWVDGSRNIMRGLAATIISEEEEVWRFGNVLEAIHDELKYDDYEGLRERVITGAPEAAKMLAETPNARSARFLRHLTHYISELLEEAAPALARTPRIFQNT